MNQTGLLFSGSPAQSGDKCANKSLRDGLLGGPESEKALRQQLNRALKDGLPPRGRGSLQTQSRAGHAGLGARAGQQGRWRHRGFSTSDSAWQWQQRLGQWQGQDRALTSHQGRVLCEETAPMGTVRGRQHPEEPLREVKARCRAFRLSPRRSGPLDVMGSEGSSWWWRLGSDTADQEAGFGSGRGVQETREWVQFRYEGPF